MYLQMQGPSKPLPRIPPAFPKAAGEVAPMGAKAPRPRNSTAGLLSMLAIGAATLVTQELRPSKRVLSRMRRARMARRFRNYRWEEAGKDGRELRVYIPVGYSIKDKDVEIELSESRLKVSLGAASVIDSELFDSAPRLLSISGGCN